MKSFRIKNFIVPATSILHITPPKIGSCYWNDRWTVTLVNGQSLELITGDKTEFHKADNALLEELMTYFEIT